VIRRRCPRTLALFLGLVVGIVLAAVTTVAAAESEVERRVADDVEAALLQLAEAGVLTDDEDGVLTVQRAPRVRFELGAVVEVRPDTRGAPVVAITPAGSAEQMGLKVGDRILVINGVDLARSADPRSDFARSTARANGRLQLTVRRGDREMQLQGTAQRVLVPGFRLRVEHPTLDQPATTPVE
jgi:S1-C subfamily serine protease